MAESQKGTSSSVDPKEKKSSLDEEVGKEFLGSWKSLSVTGDETMDFSFDTVPSGKRKTFNFDKLDMDFNLDGDFDKLTSFKLDMPDLDFSSPSKKTAKPKESSKGESSRANHQGKQDCFTFSFDFNELDNFNFDSTLIQGERKASMKNPDCKGAGSDRNEHQGSKVNPAGGPDAFDDSQTNKLHASENATSSIVETTFSGAATGNSSSDNFPSKRGNFGDLVVPHSTRTSPEKIISASTEEADQQSYFLEKAMPTEACAQPTTQILPVQSVHVKHEGKQDCFTFSFDFNESGNFNSDSTLIQGQKKTSMKNPDSKGPGSDRSEHQSSKVNLAGGDDAFDDSRTKKLPASENATSSIVETTVDGAGPGNSSNGNFPSKYGNFENLVVPHSTKTSLEKIISANTEEANQQSCILEKARPMEACAQPATQILPVKSVDGNDSTQDTESDILASPLATKVNTKSVAEDNVSDTDRMITVVGINCENSQLNSAPPYFNGLEIARNKSVKTDGEAHTGNLIGTEPLPDDQDIEASSTSSLLQTRPCGFNASEDIQMSASKLLVPTRSEHVVNNVTPIKEKKLEVVRSKFFKRSKEVETKIGQPPSTTVEGSSFGSKAIDANCPANGKREGFNAINAQTQRKLIGDSKSFSMEMTKEPALLGSEKNVKNPCNTREGLNGDAKQNVYKLVTNPKPPDKEVTKKDSIVPGSGMNIKDLSNFGANKSSTQTSANSTAVVSCMGSTWNSKMISVEGLKAGKRTPDLSGLKISRTLGVSKDQSNALLKREINFLRNSEKNREVQGFTESKIVHPIVNAEKKTLLNASLKRKTASNVDILPLNPQKRLSHSPNETRNVKEPLEITVEEQGCNHDNQAESNALYDHPTSKLEIPQQETTKEQDIPLAMEDDRNVEKAEAYAKELEDIVNMLKKKYDEAKEILVRAIVNNNSLLMLNHPMFDEKISFQCSLLFSLLSLPSILV
ncbi:uncharacterized protein At4g18490 isoform X2 [Hevea brasiliensis]|uniref:uncharacterized protein At4g18490 isoform X2 n=1 Tax=Hevea brasiliensis TaxID=3981 RepID=UPI0025DFCBD7|nr:uncharacterized protein At4g18490 isoform X2 [Hevea brasiliensis]